MLISLIWAMDAKRLIGVNNALPWKLPADMSWFREHTLGKPVLMGRNTFESFGGKPLPDRTNIVVTREENYKAPGALVAHSIEEALALAEEATDADEVMVIGGASFYAQTLPLAHKLYITHVLGAFKGDAWFPEFDMRPFKKVDESVHPIDDKNSYACRFCIYERVTQTNPD